MGLFCQMFDHKQEAINFWGDEAEYILFKCKRCGEEEIYCSYEGKCLPNNDQGKEIFNKMRNDKEFSRACHIHTEFIMVEASIMFDWKKQEREFDKLREKFGLAKNARPACPVEMYKKGLWVDKKGTGEKPKPSNDENKIKAAIKSKGEAKPKQTKGEKSTKNRKSKVSNVVDGGENLEQLQRLEKIYAKDENYERAAEIHKKILKLKNDVK